MIYVYIYLLFLDTSLFYLVYCGTVLWNGSTKEYTTMLRCSLDTSNNKDNITASFHNHKHENDSNSRNINLSDFSVLSHLSLPEKIEQLASLSQSKILNNNSESKLKK